MGKCAKEWLDLSTAYSSHSTTVPSIWKNGSPTLVCQFWGLLRIRLLSVSRILVCVMKQGRRSEQVAEERDKRAGFNRHAHVLSGIRVGEVCEREGTRVSVVAERVCERGTRV